MANQSIQGIEFQNLNTHSQINNYLSLLFQLLSARHKNRIQLNF